VISCFFFGNMASVKSAGTFHYLGDEQSLKNLHRQLQKSLPKSAMVCIPYTNIFAFTYIWKKSRLRAIVKTKKFILLILCLSFIPLDGKYSALLTERLFLERYTRKVLCV